MDRRRGSSMRRTAAIGLLAWVVVASCAVASSPSPGSSSATPTFSPSATPTFSPSAIATPTRSASPTKTPVPAATPLVAAGAWHATADMITAHASHTSTLLADGKVLVAGGVVNDRLDGQVSAATEVYDPSSAAWTASKAMTEARWGHTATLLPGGKVLVAGSYINSDESRASAELYDPRTRKWTATGNMTAGRGGHTATLLSDGTVLVAGGYTLSAPDGLASAELYDPRTGKWTATASMGSARQGHTATLLVDGRVLVVGGGGEVRLAEGPPYGATAELYDPVSGTWIATGSMAMARFGHAATRLQNGTVFVVGGSSGDDATARSAELYDPTSGRWTVTTSMANARSGHTATLLLDGTVLVASGVGLGSEPRPLASAERYDPTSATWTATGGMTQARLDHTAILLPDGTVLVMGDYDYESRASTELYDPASGT